MNGHEASVVSRQSSKMLRKRVLDRSLASTTSIDSLPKTEIGPVIFFFSARSIMTNFSCISPDKQICLVLFPSVHSFLPRVKSRDY